MGRGFVHEGLAAMRRLVAQVVRFCLVGGIVYLVDFLVFLAVLELAAGGHIAANVLGRGAGALTGFVLHRSMTFGVSGGGLPRHAAGYGIVFIANVVLSSALLGVGVDVLGAPQVSAKLAVDAFLILATFLAFRLAVFKSH
jgi:putative flippase GtrA